MRSPMSCLLAVLVLGGALGSNLGADPPVPPGAPTPKDAVEEDPTPPALVERIRAAITAGVAWLEQQPASNGSWGPTYLPQGTNYNGTNDVYVTPYGPTALAVYTLLKCDVPLARPAVRKGLKHLREGQREKMSAYELSMCLLAATATADPFKRTRASKAAGEKVKLTGEHRAWAEECLDALLRRRGPLGWRYWGARDSTLGGPQDLSSTQLAAMALLAAERSGLKVEPEAWLGILRLAMSQQETQGPEHPRAVHSRGEAPAVPGAAATQDRARGFAYVRDARGLPAHETQASGGMTACGLSAILAARFALSTRAPKYWVGEDAEGVQRAIYDGLAWLDRNWSPWSNPPDGRSWNHLYYLYGVERAMDLVGAHVLGKHLWYAEMAEEILKHQERDGHWTGGGSAVGPATAVLDTCFALLFLERATKGGIPVPSVTGGSEAGPPQR